MLLQSEKSYENYVRIDLPPAYRHHCSHTLSPTSVTKILLYKLKTDAVTLTVTIMATIYFDTRNLLHALNNKSFMLSS